MRGSIAQAVGTAVEQLRNARTGILGTSGQFPLAVIRSRVWFWRIGAVGGLSE